VTLLFLILGVAGLYFGAEWLVVGASRIALSLNVAPLVIGLTVVAFGTSMPELVTGGQAAWTGNTDIALGNVVGSNIANLGLILGLSALIRAVPCGRQIFRRELPLMLLASVLVFVLAATGVISRFWGVMLCGGLLAFTWATLRFARRGRSKAKATDLGGTGLDPAAEVRVGIEIARAVAGLVALMLGAKLLVDAAIVLARNFGVPEFLIAASMVALGTSLPELATSMVAALRGEADVLVGNIVGSNVFNLLGGLGIAAAIEPVPVSEAVLNFDLPVMLVMTAAATIALYTYRRVQRWEGGVLLLGYGAYIVALFA